MIRPAGYGVPPGALGLVAKSVAVGATTSSIEVLWEQSGSIAASTVLENKRPATVNLLKNPLPLEGRGRTQCRGSLSTTPGREQDSRRRWRDWPFLLQEYKGGYSAGQEIPF